MQLSGTAYILTFRVENFSFSLLLLLQVLMAYVSGARINVPSTNVSVNMHILFMSPPAIRRGGI